MMKGAEGGGFSFHNLLGGLLGYEQPSLGGLTGHQPQHDRCSTCGFSFQQFAQYGRFGCADCYTSFAKQLEPMIRRVHGGATTHTGKVPQRTGGLIKKRKELHGLRDQLQQKIQLEQFEEAAVLRDQIRELELHLEQGDE
jgi:protein arginine kinase activator